MPNNQNFKKIEEIVKNFFEKMEEEIEIEKTDFKENVLSLALKSENPQILIGEKGKTLFSLQHILKKLLMEEIKEAFYLDLDIDGYKEKKIDYLKGLARNLADEAVLTKKEKELFPMTPFERRIIHLEVAERDDVESFSIGQEPERKVVIKPKS